MWSFKFGGTKCSRLLPKGTSINDVPCFLAIFNLPVPTLSYSITSHFEGYLGPHFSGTTENKKMEWPIIEGHLTPRQCWSWSFKFRGTKSSRLLPESVLKDIFMSFEMELCPFLVNIFLQTWIMWKIPIMRTSLIVDFLAKTIFQNQASKINISSFMAACHYSILKYMFWSFLWMHSFWGKGLLILISGLEIPQPLLPC